MVQTNIILARNGCSFQKFHPTKRAPPTARRVWAPVEQNPELATHRHELLHLRQLFELLSASLRTKPSVRVLVSVALAGPPNCGQMSGDRCETLCRLLIALGAPSCGSRPANHIEVLRGPLPLAKTPTRHWCQSGSHILGGQIVSMVRLYNA